MGCSESPGKVNKQYKYETALVAILYLESKQPPCLFIPNIDENKSSISAAELIMQGHEILLQFDTLRLHIQCPVRKIISIKSISQVWNDTASQLSLEALY